MKAGMFSIATKRLGETVVLLLLFTLNSTVQAMSSPAPTQASSAVTASTSVQIKPAIKTRDLDKKHAKPEWNQLTPAQRDALAPLKNDWSGLDAFRKEKWLELANRFTSMPLEEQGRMQERMRAWIKLAPEQRQLVRQSYTRTKKIDAQQRNRQWERYQQLSEEKKKQLAANAKLKKQIVNPPRPHLGNNGAQAKNTLKQPDPEKQPLPAEETTPSATLSPSSSSLD